jgi:cation:H+ antiporter
VLVLVDFGQVALGLALLLAGGDLLVRGAASLARRLGVSPLAIGLTVVAFGTSAPELAVNVTAAWKDSGEISFGNIFGSNMANIGLIVAITALIRPLEIKGVVTRRELPMMMLATAMAAALGLDALLGEGRSVFGRGDGIVLLLTFTVFIYYTISDVMKQRADSRRNADDDTVWVARVSARASASLTRSLVYSAGGLAGLILGAHLTVDGAVGIARGFGISEVIIGLTLVAVGTSLPELAASVVAGIKGHSDIAIGNLVGSNIFNLLLVLGVTAGIRPVPVPAGGLGDLLVTGVLSLFLWLASMSQRRTIIRTEAFFLLALYLGYMAFRTATASL